MHTQPKKLIGFSLKILLTILVSLIALEFLLILFNDLVFRNSFFVYDPDLGFKTRPYAQWGMYQANEFGFNDQDYPHQKSPEVYRILILSDSFNWAGGPTKNYTALLERQFATEFGEGKVEVINAGYSQTHTGEQLKILKKFGLQYQPDLVVLGFFVGNDFIDAAPWRRRIVLGGATVDLNIHTDTEVTFLGQPLVFRDGYLFQSRLYLFLKQQWITSQVHAQEPPPETQEIEQESEPPGVNNFARGVSLSRQNYLAMEYYRMQIANWDQVPALHENEAYIFEQLSAMHDLLAENDIEFIVAAYPDEFQVDAALRQAVLTHFRADPSSYQWDRPQGQLWQFCTEHEIEYYDLLPTFQTAHKTEHSLYLPNDSHWNEVGNELAAQFLFEQLVWKVREHQAP